MRLILVTAAMLVAVPVLAEQPAKNEPGNAAVNTPDTPQPAAPVKGANSFTNPRPPTASKRKASPKSRASPRTKTASGAVRPKRTARTST